MGSGTGRYPRSPMRTGEGGGPAWGTVLEGCVAHLNRVLLGKADQIECFLAAALSGGHVLLLDGPGVGKTTLAQAYASLVAGSYARVQGTSDLLPTDLSGVSIYDQRSGQWQFHPGPLLHHVVLLDELNRLSGRTQSALLEAMAEAQVYFDGVSHPVPHPFTVVATPDATAGATMPVIDGVADRFAVSLSLGLPDEASEVELVSSPRPAATDLPALVGPAELQQLRTEIGNLFVSRPVVEYAVALVRSCRSVGWLSPRASQALLATARGRAALRHRDHVDPDDVRELLPAVVAHRLHYGSGAGPPGSYAAAVSEAVAAVPVPRPGR